MQDAPNSTDPQQSKLAPAITADGDVTLQKVWDVPVRVFHWGLTLAVTAGWLLGKFGPFDKSYHFYMGYLIGGLLVFRLIWGVVGSKPARFRSFVAGPVSVARYVSRMFSRHPSHWHGHNPLGGWFVVAMLCALAVQVATGLMADDEIANSGPLASAVSATMSAEATALHYNVSRIILALVGLHVAAIIFYWVWKREDLVKPMFDGKKLVRTEPDPSDDRPRSV